MAKEFYLGVDIEPDDIVIDTHGNKFHIALQSITTGFAVPASSFWGQLYVEDVKQSIALIDEMENLLSTQYHIERGSEEEQWIAKALELLKRLGERLEADPDSSD